MLQFIYVLPLAFVANAMFVATMQRLVHYAGGEQTAAPPAPSNWPRSALR